MSPPTVTGGPPHGDTIDRAVINARAVFSETIAGYVQVPAAAHVPIRVRLRLQDDPHPNGRSSVWLHPDSAEVLQVNRWSSLDPGTRAYAIIYPLHTGELWGLPATMLTLLAGLGLLGFLLAGGLLWWQRTKARRRPGAGVPG